MPMQREQLVRHKIEIYVEARDDATAEEYYRRIANAADDGDTLNSLWVETQTGPINLRWCVLAVALPGTVGQKAARAVRRWFRLGPSVSGSFRRPFLGQPTA